VNDRIVNGDFRRTWEGVMVVACLKVLQAFAWRGYRKLQKVSIGMTNQTRDFPNVKKY
jgi:hypothetical protein